MNEEGRIVHAENIGLGMGSQESEPIVIIQSIQVQEPMTKSTEMTGGG